MQTDEEVGKVAAAVPVIIYILFIEYLMLPLTVFTIIKLNLHFP